jgi:catechol 2,3-dioxygenase-like lactoylglutathione lyase family enzyme
VSGGWRFEGWHHVLLAMPPGGEEAADGFYAERLGLEAVPKPAHLATRGGRWYRGAGLELHLGAEDGFRASTKSHPAMRVRGLAELRRALERDGVTVTDDTQLEGHERWYVTDPFGNRLELIEEVTA